MAKKSYFKYISEPGLNEYFHFYLTNILVQESMLWLKYRMQILLPRPLTWHRWCSDQGFRADEGNPKYGNETPASKQDWKCGQRSSAPGGQRHTVPLHFAPLCAAVALVVIITQPFPWHAFQVSRRSPAPARSLAEVHRRASIGSLQ